MIRSGISCDSNHLILGEESGFGLLSLNLPSTNLSKNHQDHSPRPSLKSFGSEIRCSIDELDAVIATYDVNNNNEDDIESKRQQLLTFSLTNIPSVDYFNYSTFTNSPSLSNQLSSLNRTTISNMNYVTSITHNSNINDYHHNINDINEIRKYYDQLDVNSSSYPTTTTSSSGTFTNYCNQIEPSFPLPPPDAFASDDFPLPPSPPPPLPPLLSSPTSEATTGSAKPVTVLTSHFSSTTFSPCTTNSTLTTLNGGKHLQSFPSTNGYSQCQSFDPKCHVESTINSYNTNNGHHTQQFRHNIPTTNSRKPSIPQRAPSTRLTSLPSWPKHHYMETSTSDTMITSNAIVTGNNGIDHSKTKHSVESSKENNNNNNNNHSIECTTLPVQDIIRKFGSLVMSNAKVSNQCNTTSNVQSTLSSIIRPNSINDRIPDSNNTNNVKKSINHKYNQLTLSTNSQYSPITTGLATSTALASQNNAIQEVVMSTTSSSSSPLLNRNINQSSSSDMNHSYQMMNISSGKLSKGNFCANNNISSTLPYPFSSNSTNVTITTTTTTVSNHHKSFIDSLYVNGKFLNDKCSISTNSSYQSTTSTILPEEYHQTNSSCTTFNSGNGNIPNGLSKLRNRVHSSHCTINNDVNNSTNHYIHSQQSHHQQLNSHVVHQLNGTTSLQHRSSSDCSSNSPFIHVQSMNLDPQTLTIFNQFNIVDANQIPGYHPISSNLPDWKIHRLERKNRDAANIYAETNPHQPQHYNNDKSLTTTNELAEKLQRRLDEVTKATIE
ncbi:unnamed protein product [Schistosoma margrebowiei]|uniref:Uncharacterized protein n=1 Tax=Schistosoma margrebowiei TaxID=48269 RepID=A0A183L8V6_9TREM|nr:unnamed protein product [Schistosoma margrebowiei]